MHKKLAVILMIVIVAAISAWLLIPAPILDGDQHKDNEATDKLVIAAYKGDFSSLLWIAESRGFFRDNGLDVQIQEYDSGVVPVRKVLAGQADIATSGEFVAVNHIFKSKELMILSAIALGDAIEFIARRDSGILKPTDLKGKKIGLKKDSQADFFLNTFLVYNGMSVDDVQVVDINPSQMESAMHAGELDAVVVWNPFAYRIKEMLGENAEAWDVQEVPFFFLTITRKGMLDEQPDVVRRFLKSMASAAGYIHARNSEARMIVRDRLGYDERYSIASWDRLEFRFGLPKALLVAMESEARWMIDNRLSDSSHVPDYLEHMAISALADVDPDAIQIIH